MPDYLVKASVVTPGHLTPTTRERIVRAKTRAQAIAHVTRDTIACEVATSDDVFRIAKAGGVIEQASDE